MAKVTTYADAFGIWHAEVEETGIGNAEAAYEAAFEAIETEIVARHQNDILTGIRIQKRTSRDGILTTYFVEVPADQAQAA